jgi:integrase
MLGYQRGALRVIERKQGRMWQFRFYIIDSMSGKKKERSEVIGSLADFPNESACRREIDRRHLVEKINQPRIDDKVRFRQIADFYLNSDAFRKLAHTTRYCYKHIIDDYLVPHWGEQFAVDIKSLVVEAWLRALDLADSTRGKTKYVMMVVFLHAEKYDRIPEGFTTNLERKIDIESSSNYEAVILTPKQTFTILKRMRQPESTMTLLVAATGLRFSEVAGLQWQDVDFANDCIHVRRTWIDGIVSEKLKTKQSRSAVPMAAELAQVLKEWRKVTVHGTPTDWVFASLKTHGKTPRVGNMLVADHLRPAAIKAGVLLKPGQRFGFHNLRHSLSSLLITGHKSDVRTTQDILRHRSSTTTVGIYTQSSMAQRIAAQESVLRAILKQPARRARTRKGPGHLKSGVAKTSRFHELIPVESKSA